MKQKRWHGKGTDVDANIYFKIVSNGNGYESNCEREIVVHWQMGKSATFI